MQPLNRFQTIRRLLSLGCCLVVLLSFLPPAAAAQEDLVARLKGHQSSLHGENLPVPLLLQAIGRQAGVNIFVAGNIKDTITINVDNLTLYDIFQIVMEAKGLRYSERNKVIFVEKATDYHQPPQKLLTVRLCTQYGNAAGYLGQLKPLLGSQGRIAVADRGNCLIVQGHKETINRIQKMLAELDQPTPQVHIEARIVTVTEKAKQQLGIVWNAANTSSTGAGLRSAIADLSLTNPSTSLTVGFIRDNLNLGVELQALQQENLARILSAPRVVVLDGKQAEIKQGTEVPFTAAGGSGVVANTSFREANLSLKVTPKILPDNFISLDVVVTNDSVDLSSTVGSNSEPLIDTQEITTSLLLENNVTVVIGGILQENNNHEHQGVPGLSGIPVLGHLFKNSQKQNERSELLVFITPTVMPMRAPSRKGREGSLKKILSEGPLLSNGGAAAPVVPAASTAPTTGRPPARTPAKTP